MVAERAPNRGRSHFRAVDVAERNASNVIDEKGISRREMRRRGPLRRVTRHGMTAFALARSNTPIHKRKPPLHSRTAGVRPVQHFDKYEVYEDFAEVLSGSPPVGCSI